MEILNENAPKDVSSVDEQLLINFGDIHFKSNYIESGCDRLTLFTSSTLETENSQNDADLEKNKKTNKMDRRENNVKSNPNIDKVSVFISFFFASLSLFP